MPSRRDLTLLFSGLASSAYRTTSPASSAYNCLAWAAGEPDRWWWPDSMGIYHWPKSVERREALEVFEQAYAVMGYSRCDNPDVESGCEKVAIFSNEAGKPTHAARQLGNGLWTSKLGQLEDIEHELRALEGPRYGRVAVILRRRRAATHSP